MENLKSNSNYEPITQLENFTYVASGTNVNQSTSYDVSNNIIDKMDMFNEVKFKKSKSTTNGSTSKKWSSIDQELQRKKRVASYKVYTIEGKVKKSFFWFKKKITQVIVSSWR